MEEVRLWRKNSLGIGTWRVRQQPLTGVRGQLIISHSSVEGGSEISHIDMIDTNNSGRTVLQQMELEMTARIRRQLDKGYKRTREEALLGSTNQMGLVNPMLAQSLSKVKLLGSHFANAYVQRKFDGHRCLITKQGGEMLAYTRKGKPITTIPHILEDAERWMMDGDTLDGELYIHGRALQGISSIIKREQPDSRLLTFNWYDMVLNNVFGARHNSMVDLFANVQTPMIKLVETVKVERMSEVYAWFKVHRAEGYEGSMLRLSIAGYEDAKRALQLIKVKEREDGEVTTVGVRASANGWAILRVRYDVPGRMVGYPVSQPLIVEFDISAPGSVVEKTEVLTNYEAKYHNRRLTIEYAMLTDEGIPFHAVATRWFEEL